MQARRRRFPRAALALTILGCGHVGCTPPAITPHSECSSMVALEDDASPDAVLLPVRVENHLGEVFEVRTLCVSIDGRRISDAWAKHPGTLLREHQPVELGARLRAGVVHRVRVIVLLFGTGRAEGYTFVVTTEHEIPPDELRPEVLTAEIVEFGGADTPIQMRPQVHWHGPGSNPTK